MAGEETEMNDTHNHGEDTLKSKDSVDGGGVASGEEVKEKVEEKVDEKGDEKGDKDGEESSGSEEESDEEDSEEDFDVVLDVNLSKSTEDLRLSSSSTYRNQRFSIRRPGLSSSTSDVRAQPALPSAPLESAFDLNLDDLEEKPWRKPGSDLTDYFNYGFNEGTWRAYCLKQAELRKDQQLQGQIHVYESKGKQRQHPEESHGNPPENNHSSNSSSMGGGDLSGIPQSRMSESGRQHEDGRGRHEDRMHPARRGDMPPEAPPHHNGPPGGWHGGGMPIPPMDGRGMPPFGFPPGPGGQMPVPPFNMPIPPVVDRERRREERRRRPEDGRGMPEENEGRHSRSRDGWSDERSASRESRYDDRGGRPDDRRGRERERRDRGMDSQRGASPGGRRERDYRGEARGDSRGASREPDRSYSGPGKRRRSRSRERVDDDRKKRARSGW